MFKFNYTCPACKQSFIFEAEEKAGDQTFICPHCSRVGNLRLTEGDVRRNQKLRDKNMQKQAKRNQQAAQQAQAPANVAPEVVAAKVRRYEIVSNIVWIVIGIIQCITITAAAAGIWNVVNAIIRMRNTKNIVAHNEHVPPYFDERKVWIIVMAIVNLVLGGVIGVVIALFDWYVRDYVLKNRSAFEE